MDWECTAGRCSGQEDGTDHAELVSSSKRRGHHAEAAALSGSGHKPVLVRILHRLETFS